VHYLC